MKHMIMLTIIAMLAFSACTKEDRSHIDSFENCVSEGGAVAESFPRQCILDGQSFTEDIDIPDQCTINGGKWIGSASECEDISRDTCDMLGGNFNECASACRNDPEAQVCTMQCVLVCEFDGSVTYVVEDETPEHVCTEDEIKSKMCTRDYRPVCGDDGIEYSNGCTACSSGNIKSYTEGKC